MMKRWIAHFFIRKAERLEVRFLTYAAADNLIKETGGAWTIAPEEDRNRCPGMVYLELLVKP